MALGGASGRKQAIELSEITFFWKEIRQKGNVQISGAGFAAQIPYEIVVGGTFDQQQVDVP